MMPVNSSRSSSPSPFLSSLVKRSESCEEVSIGLRFFGLKSGMPVKPKRSGSLPALLDFFGASLALTFAADLASARCSGEFTAEKAFSEGYKEAVDKSKSASEDISAMVRWEEQPLFCSSKLTAAGSQIGLLSPKMHLQPFRYV
jgi:hypothetical protein